MKIRTPQKYALKIMDLKQLKKLPYKELQIMILQNQQLTQVPEELYMCQLQTLVLDDNLLNSIDLSSLQSLEQLSIENNQLTSLLIPQSTYQLLLDLRVLRAKQNQITYINTSNLEELDIRENQLNIINVDMKCRLKNLKIGWSRVLRRDTNISIYWDQLEAQVLHNISGECDFRLFITEAVQLCYSLKVLNAQETDYTERLNEISDFSFHLKEDILHICIINDDEYLMNKVISLDYNCSTLDSTQSSPLSLAIRKFKPQFVKVLIKKVNIQKEVESFHIAIKTGQISLVKQLLELGMDPNCYDCMGNTPLTTALTNITQINMQQIIQLLLIGGAKPNLFNKNGMNAFQACIKKSNLSALKFIITHNLSARNYDQIFKLNLKNILSGDQSYHSCVRYSSIPILILLIEHRIGDVFSKNYNNQTAFQLGLQLESRFNLKQHYYIPILKIVKRIEQFKIHQQFQKRYDMPQRIDPIDSDSSCPNISDNEEYDQIEKLKINVVRGGEQILQAKHYEIYEKSDESESSDEDEEILLSQQPKDTIFHNNKTTNNRRGQILLKRFQEQRLRLKHYRNFQKFNPSLQEQVQYIILIRQELSNLSILKQYHQLIDLQDQMRFYGIVTILEYIETLQQLLNKFDIYL